jgi:hypothetical protein
MGEKYSFSPRTMVPQEIGPIFPKEPWFPQRNMDFKVNESKFLRKFGSQGK